MSNRGKNFLKLIEEVRGVILNGTSCGDREGELTHVSSKGRSVIDYAIVNDNGYDLVKEFRIGERVDSDHMPLIVTIEEEGECRAEEEVEEEGERRISRRWDEEARKMYRKKTYAFIWKNRSGGGTLEEKWADLKRTIQEAMVKEE